MRKSGVLMHLSSLPSPYGIGTTGIEARRFADFLSEAGQTCWQLLPICPTGYGDSPYQSFSTFAGNPYFIDLDTLTEEGLLLKSEYTGIDWESLPDDVNYDALYRKRYPVLKLAAGRFLKNPPQDYSVFCQENSDWLDDYALFMTAKELYDGCSWWLWEESIRMRRPKAIRKFKKENEKTIAFWNVMQYLFFRQWQALKSYINQKGISIIGDLPIYVSHDSVDVWSHPELFQLDETLMPEEVSGCPPDGFSAVGQRWGNPLFDWDAMKQTGYAWWVKRIGYACQIYDILRIDHFRGFESYYAIPYNADTAQCGHWKKGPGIDLFRSVERTIGRQSIIAEDLGFLTESVHEMLRESGFPGMRVLELAFDSRDTNGDIYLPHNFTRNCIAYTGTHDNDTIQGWIATADPDDVTWAREYFHFHEPQNCHWDMMRGLWASVADTTIVQAQDLLGLGSEARMNEPSTIGKNWRWRALPGDFTPELAAKLRHLMQVYQRL